WLIVAVFASPESISVVLICPEPCAPRVLLSLLPQSPLYMERLIFQALVEAEGGEYRAAGE
ncbi:MAG: hypothetical protein AAGJ55_08670, partial [Cyanobacteria bacterium J06555_12]